jgi:hypothetical protein
MYHWYSNMIIKKFFFFFKKATFSQVYDARTQEAGGPQVQSQPGLHSRLLSQKNKVK